MAGVRPGGPGGRASGPASAWRFLTRIQLPAWVPGGWESFGLALPWFPAVGLALGTLLALADVALRLAGVGPAAASVLLVALLLVLSGALHLDGLVDTADAVFSPATPERRLEIMRDPRAGAFGVAAASLVLLLKVAALYEMPAAGRVWALVLGPVLGRWAIVLAATLFPYGREAGLGTPLKATATRGALLLPGLTVAVVALVGGWAGIATAAATSLVVVALGRWLLSKLPAGLTGDCYGALCETAEALALLLAGALVGRLGVGWGGA